MFGLQELLESTIEEMLATGHLDQHPDNDLESSVTDMIPGLSSDIASLILVRIKKDAASGLKRHRRDRKGFEKRLNERWKCPLDLLDLVIALTVEAGTEFNRKFRNEAVGSGDAVFEALTRLHARACQVSGEVLALLHAGFADGAHARWRSLHEMAVVASLIQDNGQELAERYLFHEKVQQYKLACEYEESWGRLNVEPLSKETLDSLKVQRDELIARFGEAFKGDYGWASSAIGSNHPTMSDIERHVQLGHMRPYYRMASDTLDSLKVQRDELIARFGEAFKGDYGWASSAIGSNHPTMSDIERHVQLGHMRPYYRMASDNVHPNSHGAYFRLGLHSSQQGEVLLAGPSNVGLANPGHSTAISLLQITTNLLATKSVFDCVVTMKILEELTNEVGEAFLKVHQELETLVTDNA